MDLRMHAASHALAFDSALVDISQLAAQQIRLCAARGMVLMPQSLLRAGSPCVIFQLGWMATSSTPGCMPCHALGFDSALVGISQVAAHQLPPRVPHGMVQMPQSLLRAPPSCVMVTLGWMASSWTSGCMLHPTHWPSTLHSLTFPSLPRTKSPLCEARRHGADAAELTPSTTFVCDI